MWFSFIKHRGWPISSLNWPKDDFPSCRPERETVKFSVDGCDWQISVWGWGGWGRWAEMFVCEEASSSLSEAAVLTLCSAVISLKSCEVTACKAKVSHITCVVLGQNMLIWNFAINTFSTLMTLWGTCGNISCRSTREASSSHWRDGALLNISWATRGLIQGNWSRQRSS